MAYFTVILKLTKKLPDVLQHNFRFSLHFGDFVLPKLLFVVVFLLYNSLKPETLCAQEGVGEGGGAVELNDTVGKMRKEGEEGGVWRS